jgi:PST family polysaccharide transporter
MKAPQPMNELIRLSARGGTWLFARRIMSNMIRLGATAILARHLSPADFGLVALAQAVLGFITFYQETGIGTYVVYDREKNWEERIQSAFWLNTILAGVLIGILAILLPAIRILSDHPDLTSVMIVLGVVFFLRQMQIVPENLLKRRLDYRSLVIRDTVIDILSAVLSLSLALTGWGLWSLVLPSLFAEPLRLITIFHVSQWRPKFRLGTSHWRRISRYSFPLMGTNMISFVMNDGDTLLVGKVLGNHVLGIYNLAWQLSNIVGKNIGSIVANVGTASFSALENNLERVRSAYLRVERLLAVVTFPILSMMFVLADDLILVVYGPQWGDASILLRVFLIYAAIRSVATLSGMIFNVVGRTGTSFKISLWYFPFFVTAILIGVWQGAFEVALAVVIVRSICSLHSWLLASQCIQLPHRLLVQSLLPIGAITLAAAIFVWLTQTALGTVGAQPLVRVLVSVSFGMLPYFIGMIWCDKQTYAEVVELISSVVPRVGKNLALLQR